jgi:4-alpha-glucanotransferase
MTPSVQLCLVLHNHQPIGNFEEVFEQAYRDSYLPFLDVFEPYTSLSISLHTSGPLMMWLAERHPEYIDRLRMLVEAGRVEIIGGPQYEPILAMLPRRDRIGQIRCYTSWLERTLGGKVAGMWTPERVWEASMASDIVAAGIGYTVLDDFHFRAAGLADDQLSGYYVTEDDGAVLRVFPGSERLRYTIPFAPVQETIDYCWHFAQSRPGTVITCGDDGEKFGTWPDTHRHVYQDGWLRSLFDALSDNASWLHTVTLAEAVQKTPPTGKVYLPDCSYREMTQWALPTDRQQAYERVASSQEQSSVLAEARSFARGGFWRNFRVKYTEANEMYARMMYVSRRLQKAELAGGDAGELAVARDHLYRGQCNCPYWHGTFGGVYLPHLRNAIYHHLIEADAALDRAQGAIDNAVDRESPYVEATVDDYDFDLLQEVRLANEQFTLWLAPGQGGRLYEWDVRSAAHNLLSTLQRRPEAYHDKVLSGATNHRAGVASIHDRVVFKQADLHKQLQYDRYPRKSMMDHFFDQDATLDQVASGQSMERGDFVNLPFDAKIRRASDRVQLQMRRDGNAWGFPITITKAVTVFAGSDELGITYLLENLPQGRTLHFAVEMNFAGMPAGADDRFFSGAGGERLGQLGQRLDLTNADTLGLTDQWLDLAVLLELDRSGGMWAFPVETVSQSEAGFERVHQSVCVMPHWTVQGDAAGRWAVQMTVRACRASTMVSSAVLKRTLEFVS